MRSFRLLTRAVVLLSFAYFPRAQRGRDGQSPNQNLEKFSSFGTPLYGLYRYVRPQRVWFFSCFGHKWGIDFSHKLGMGFVL